MKIIVTKNSDELAKEALKVMLNIVKNKPNAVLGLATGSSPIGLYNEMIADHKSNGTSYKDIRTVNLDEYVGLGIENNQSYVYFMNDNLFKSLDINKDNINLPNGKANDPDSECIRYTALLDSMPQDIQLLGIGGNGHIGFNEPGTAFDSTTHIVELEEGTRKDNSRFFATLDDVPTHAITMGIRNIMNAKQILVVANGASKARAVYDMVKGKVSESCPASILQRHCDVVLVIDEAASELLQ